MNELINVSGLTQETSVYCSVKAETPEEKKALYNVTNTPAERLGDHINETITVKDIFCEIVNCTNTETGETTPAPRIVFIDDKGTGYACVSLGIFSAVKKLFAMFGEPTWEKGLKIKVKQITKGAKTILSIQLA